VQKAAMIASFAISFEKVYASHASEVSIDDMRKIAIVIVSASTSLEEYTKSVRT
jgi:hypothetical protein